MLYRALCFYISLSLSFCLPLAVLGQDNKQASSSAVQELARSVAAAASDTERDTLLKANQALVTVDLISALIEVATKGKDNQRRLALLEYIKGIARQIGDQPNLIRILLEIGKIELSLEIKSKADQSFEEVRGVLPAIKNALRVGLILAEVGQSYNSYQFFSDSPSWFQEALKVLEGVPGKDGARARGMAWLGLAVAQEETSQYDQAFLSLRNAETLFTEADYQLGLAKVYGERGSLYDYLGNAEFAKESHMDALRAFNALGAEKYKLEIAKVKINIAILQTLRLGEEADALENDQAALRLAKDELSKWELAATYGNMAIALTHLKRYPEALNYIQLSYDLFKDSEGNSRTSMGFELSQRAYVQLGMHKPEEALGTATKASQMDPNNSDLSIQTLIIRGRALRELKRFDEARKALAQAISLIEDNQAHAFGNEEAQSGFFESQVFAYRDMVQSLIEQGEPEEAFKYTERYKARALLGALVNGRSDFTAGMTLAEREKEKTLEREYAELNSKFLAMEQSNQRNEGELAKLREEVAAARRRQQEFYLSIYATHAELRRRRAVLPDLSLQQIGHLLPDTSWAALQYVVSDYGAFLLVITKQSNDGPARITPIPLTSDIEHLNSAVYEFRGMLDESPRAGFVPVAQDLHHILIEKALPYLAGKKSLIIVPDEMLWELPFQALLARDKRYLIQDYAISYAPSLTALSEMERLKDTRAASGAQKFLAFANPDLGSAVIQNRQKSNPRLMGGPLQSLPEAEAQVDNIAKIFGERKSIYRQAGATETRVKTEAPSARIIHLAAHGRVNSATPMYSYIVLSQVGNPAGEDGLLEAWELMNIPLQADMVVLSACETARGRVRPGEGLIGLSWAVSIAGCPTIISSQWKVDPTSTSLQMQDFYQYLYSGKLKVKPGGEWITEMSKAEALQKAAINLLDPKSKYKHPHYWAGFIVIGDPR